MEDEFVFRTGEAGPGEGQIYAESYFFVGVDIGGGVRFVPVSGNVSVTSDGDGDGIVGDYVWSIEMLQAPMEF